MSLRTILIAAIFVVLICGNISAIPARRTETMLVDTLPPVVRLVWPDSGAFVSCDFVVVEMVLTDDFFIDRESILLSVFAELGVHSVPESLVSFVDSFYYFPIRMPMVDGDTVELLMNPVTDFNDNESPSFWWSFIIDMTGPEITDPEPIPGSEIANPRPPISATLDDHAGIAIDSCTISIDGLVYPLLGTYVTWSGTRFTFHTDWADMFFRGGDTIEVCVHVEDEAEGCGFNKTDSCWSFSVPLGGPVADMTFPPNGEWMSCPDSGAIFRIEDADGIEPDSIWLVFGEDTIRFGDAGLVWAAPFAYLDLTPFGDGWFSGELHACDIFGNRLDPPLSFGFGIDTEKPYLSGEYPAAYSRSGDLDPVVTFDILDDLSGVRHMPTLAGVSVDGSSWSWFSLSDYEFSVIGDSYTLDSIAIPSLHGGDTVTVRVLVHDSVTVCHVNQLDTSWFFYIPSTPPVSDLILPFGGSVSACGLQGVWFAIADSDGIVPSSIVLDAGGTYFDISSPELDWDGVTLRFEPSSGWSHGSHITGSLISVHDSLFNGLAAPVSFDFYIDLEPPQVVSTSPAELALVHDTLREVRLRIEDSPAGVDPSSIEVTVNGVPFSVDGASLRWTEPYLIFAPEFAGAWDIVDTVDFCLTRAADLPDTCAPNEADIFCFTFFVDGRDPFADPPDGAIVACTEQEVLLYLWAPGGIIDSTIEFEINGRFLTVDSAGASFDGETLRYVPSAPWPDGDSVRCHLINAAGPFGGIPEVWWGFLMDYSDPVLDAVSPAPEDIVEEVDPAIEFMLVDSISGLLTGAFELTVNGNAFNIGHPALAIVGDDFIFYPATAGMHIAGGDTVEVRIHAEDLADPDYCGPNVLDSFFVFYIESGGPVAELLSPEELTPYGCDSSIVISITDDDGVDWSALEFSIDGEAFIYGDLRLSISGDSVIIKPSPASGETLTVELVHVEDSLENAAERAIWRVVFDFDPPEIEWLYPSPETTLTTRTPGLRAIVREEITGFDFDISPVSSYAILSDTIFITVDTTSPYDTLDYCISACDSAVCPNCDSACLRLYIDAAPPVADLAIPFDSATTACDLQRVVILLSDPSGISASGLIAYFGADTVTLSDSRVRLHGDSLIFEPDSAFMPGEIRVGIIYLEDRWGNVLSDFEAVFYQIAAPIFAGVSPLPGSSSPTVTPSISATIDSADSAWIEIDGAVFTDGSSGFSFDGDSIALDSEIAGLSWSAGDTVEVCAYSTNFADLCGPAVAETCWSFYILYSPPTCSIAYPECREFTACRDQGIEFALLDDEGIDTMSIVFEANGEGFDISDSELDFDPSSGILTFSPSVDWVGDSVTFCLLGISDILGAESGDVPLCCTMFLDFAPPTVEVEPPGGSYLPIPVDTFHFILRDFGSGAILDSASIDGVWFDPTDSELSFTDSVGAFYFWNEISADPPESITVCASASDSTEYCGPNDTTICWRYGLNITAPILDMIFPENGSITSCADGPLIFTATDPDGIDTNSARIVLNGSIIAAPDARFGFYGDTIRFTPDTALHHGAELCGTLTVADMPGNPSPPLDFCITIDIQPPEILSAMPEAFVLDTFTEIRFVAEDIPAGIDYASPVVVIHSDTVSYDWRGDTCAIDRSQLTLCEFDTVEVSVQNLADMATGCGANVLPDTIWRFIIADDDTMPPEVVSISPAAVHAGLPFVITAEILDISGVAEATILWTPTDSTISPESIPMFEIEPGIWAAAESIDVDFNALTVVICATDDDFDCENPLDRSFGCDTFTILLSPLALEPVSCSNWPWDPLDEFHDPLCAGEEYSAILAYFNPETVAINVDDVIDYGDSVFHIGAWTDSLVEPGDSIYFPIKIFAADAGQYSDTVWLYDTRLGYPVAIDTVWSNIVLCQFRAEPNPFTPNGDGYYDEFEIELPRGGDVEINFYRLEGMRVATLRGEGRKYFWDGEDDFGRPQPPGIYIYVIRVDSGIFKHGSVTIAR